MEHYTLTVNNQELEILKKIYQNHLVNDDNQNLFFRAFHNNSNIFAFKSGKVYLRGDDVSSELAGIKSALNRIDYDAIGSDEVGTGDVFGPIVVCSAYVSIDDIPFLEELNVRDSKNISDKVIAYLGPKIAKRIVHSLIILPPQKYNSLVKKGYNLNKIKALLHNQAIVKTTQKLNKKVPVIVDQFCQPQLYFNYLKGEVLIYRDIQFYTKAESVHVSVAAASIIARYAFLVKMSEYSKALGMKLLKGASSEVDLQLETIIKTKDQGILPNFAKMNFKNVSKLNL